MTAYEAAERIVELKPKTLLDVGSGLGHQANHFRANGIDVTTLDSHSPKSDIHASWPVGVKDLYDCVWSAHCLEHSPNPGMFIKAVTLACRPKRV